MPQGHKQGCWSDAETALLKSYVESGLSFMEIGALMPLRGEKPARERWRYINMDNAERERRILSSRARRLVGRKLPANSNHHRASVVTFARASEDALRELARKREISPRDLTAAFFGDPLPGYSALERRS